MRRLLTITLIVAVAALLGGCNDISSSHATRADAVDIIDRGWVPAVLPDSSTNIRETHNLDLNVGHGTFMFGATDAASFRAKLTPARAPRTRDIEARASLEKSGYVFYSYEDFEIAVNWKHRKGKFWLGLNR
ncbi:hypothetical protein ACFFGH_32370 [Lysobacter korlensis]|uniref:YbbD head domain-containing protein n=1 Tax=Lysobacter korlensis TaxID=553636 RepID=A0ABV6RZZ1_9GAMM